jgi:hypothetical protein
VKQRKGLLKSSGLGEQQKFGLICDDETFSFTFLQLWPDIFYGRCIPSSPVSGSLSTLRFDSHICKKEIVDATACRRTYVVRRVVNEGACFAISSSIVRSPTLLLIPVTQRLACRSYKCSRGAAYAVMRKSRVRISLGILFVFLTDLYTRQAVWIFLLLHLRSMVKIDAIMIEVSFSYFAQLQLLVCMSDYGL